MRRTVLLAFVLLLATLAPTVAAQSNPNPGVPNWVEATYQIAFPSLSRADIGGSLAFHKITTQGNTYSAQGARDLYHQMEAADPAQARAFLQGVEDQIAARVRSVLATGIPGGRNVTVDPVHVRWASLNATSGSDPYQPPIVFDVNATVPVDTNASFGTSDPSLVAALFSLGATVPVDVNLTAYPGTNATYVLVPPQPLAFGPDGNVTSLLTNWQGSVARESPVTLQVRNPDAPSFHRPDIHLNVSLDVHGLDLNLLGAPSGDLGTLKADFNLDANLFVVPVPPDAAKRIPPQAHVTDISAGQVRHLLEKGILTRSELQGYSGTILSPLRAILTGQLGATVNGSFDPSTLVGPTGLGPNPPLVFRATSHVAYPLHLGNAGGSTAAITFLGVQRVVDIPPLQGYNTTYTIVLPQGVALLGATVVGGPGSVSTTTVGGRPVLVVDAPAGQDTRVAIHAAATPGLILSQAWQLVALVLLIVLVPILLMLWRRGRRKRAQRSPAAAPTPSDAPARALSDEPAGPKTGTGEGD